jgi:hypothetical protein
MRHAGRATASITRRTLAGLLGLEKTWEKRAEGGRAIALATYRTLTPVETGTTECQSSAGVSTAPVRSVI